jgi:hypothetical protein
MATLECYLDILRSTCFEAFASLYGLLNCHLIDAHGNLHFLAARMGDYAPHNLPNGGVPEDEDHQDG